MNTWQQKKTVISKLRVKSNGLDALATRFRFEQLFGATNFLPEGLLPNVVVCIKKIRDPQPRTLRLNHDGGRFSDAWRNSVTREIENLHRRAFRPIRETVPAQAESVVFADSTELLACLAIDWQRGLLAESWWWRGLFPNLGQAQTVARIWSESAEYAPTALQLLAKREKAAGFAMKLQPNEAEDLLRRIISVFGLHKIQKVLFESIDKSEKPPDEPRENTIEKQNSPAPETAFNEIQTLAPWFKFAPETQRVSSNPARQSLLGIGLMLARAPQIVRSNEFAHQLKIFRIEFESYRKTAATRPAEISAQAVKAVLKIQTSQNAERERRAQSRFRDLTETGRDAEKFAEEKKSKFFEKPVEVKEAPVKSGESSQFSPPEIQLVAEKTAEKSSEFFDRKPQTEKKPEIQTVRNAAKSRRQERQIPAEIKFAETGEATEEFPAAIIETHFGGVFYLLNLGLYLKLYRDFTETGETEIDLNIWDFVALLGLKFIGEKIKDDAVWQFLKRLAGRETDEDFGKDYAAPDEWRIPAEWLETFQSNEKWLWSTDGKRLVVRHPENFSVIDVRWRDDSENQLKDELKIYDKDSSEINEGEFKDFPETFFGNLTEFIESRLRQALNLPTSEQIAEILFERRATAAATATHLDVTFRLADLPFAVRLSGLDRDAGWIPAAGKYVKFHFV